MKNALAPIVAAGIILTGSACFAADGIYLKGIGKYAMPSDPTIENVNLKSDNGYGLGAAIGYTVSNDFRIEGEISTQKADLDAIGLGSNDAGKVIDSGDIRMTTYMVNGYWDLHIKDGFGIYLTGGLGYGQATVSVYNVDGDDGGFAWKGGAGVFYTIDDRMAVDLGWEYVSLDNAEIDAEVRDLDSNNIVAAFRYNF